MVTVWALRSPNWASFGCSNCRPLALLANCGNVNRAQLMRQSYLFSLPKHNMKDIVAASRSVYRKAILLTSTITGVLKDPHESQMEGSQNIGSALSCARKPSLPLIDEECSSFFFAIQFCPEHTICIHSRHCVVIFGSNESYFKLLIMRTECPYSCLHSNRKEVANLYVCLFMCRPDS